MSASEIGAGMTHFLTYVGIDFYYKSKTMMSALYEMQGGTPTRWDWGKVQIALDDGDKVIIRPAEQYELDWANKELQRYL